MIQSLRRWHRRALFAAAFILPVVFAAGLLVRRPFSTTARLPVSGQQAIPIAPLPAGRELWAGWQIAARVSNTPENRLLLTLEPRALSAPDVLLYWSALPLTHETINNDAVLLGSLRAGQPATFLLPEQAGYSAGQLTLYSLAQQSVLAAASVPERSSP
jgi:hypothetical protein